MTKISRRRALFGMAGVAAAPLAAATAKEPEKPVERKLLLHGVLSGSSVGIWRDPIVKDEEIYLAQVDGDDADAVVIPYKAEHDGLQVVIRVRKAGYYPIEQRVILSQPVVEVIISPQEDPIVMKIVEAAIKYPRPDTSED